MYAKSMSYVSTVTERLVAKGTCVPVSGVEHPVHVCVDQREEMKKENVKGFWMRLFCRA